MVKNNKVSVDDLPVIQEIGDKAYVPADSLIRRETLYQKAVEVLTEHGINVESIDVEFEKVKNIWHWMILITNKDVVYRIENFGEEKWNAIRKQGNSTKSLLKKLEDKVPLAKALELVANALVNDIKQVKSEPTGETIQPFLQMIDEEITSETGSRTKAGPKVKIPESEKVDPEIPKEIKQKIEKLAESVNVSSIKLLKEIAENVVKGQKIKDAIELEAIYTSKLEKVYEGLNEEIASIEDRIQKEEKPVQESIRKFVKDILSQEREKSQEDFTNFIKKILSSPPSPEKPEKKPAKKAAKKAQKKAPKSTKETSVELLEDLFKELVEVKKVKERIRAGIKETPVGKTPVVNWEHELNWENILNTGEILFASETAVESAHKIIASALKEKEQSIDLKEILFERIGFDKNFAELKLPENKKEFLKRLDKILFSIRPIEEAVEIAVNFIKKKPKTLQNLESWEFRRIPASLQAEVKKQIRARFGEVEKTPKDEPKTLITWEYLLKTGSIILPSETAVQNAQKLIENALKAGEESIDLNDLLIKQIGLNKIFSEMEFPKNKKEFLKRLSKILSAYVSVAKAVETAVDLLKESPELLENLEELESWIFNVPESQQAEVKERIKTILLEKKEQLVKPSKKAAKKASKKAGRPTKKMQEESPKTIPIKQEAVPVPTQGDLEGDLVVIDKHGKDEPTGFLLENFKTIEKFGKAYLKGKKIIARTEIGRQYLKESNSSQTQLDAGKSQPAQSFGVLSPEEKQLLEASKKLAEAWENLPESYSKHTEDLIENEISPLEEEVRESLIRAYAKNPKDPDMEEEDWATEQSQQSGRTYKEWEFLIKSGAFKIGGAENRSSSDASEIKQIQKGSAFEWSFALPRELRDIMIKILETYKLPDEKDFESMHHRDDLLKNLREVWESPKNERLIIRFEEYRVFRGLLQLYIQDLSGMILSAKHLAFILRDLRNEITVQPKAPNPIDIELIHLESDYVWGFRLPLESRVLMILILETYPLAEKDSRKYRDDLLKKLKETRNAPKTELFNINQDEFWVIKDLFDLYFADIEAKTVRMQNFVFFWDSIVTSIVADVVEKREKDLLKKTSNSIPTLYVLVTFFQAKIEEVKVFIDKKIAEKAWEDFVNKETIEHITYEEFRGNNSLVEESEVAGTQIYEIKNKFQVIPEKIYILVTMMNSDVNEVRLFTDMPSAILGWEKYVKLFTWEVFKENDEILIDSDVEGTQIYIIDKISK